MKGETTTVIEDEERKYLREVTVGVIGGGIIVELLKRFNLKEVRIIESSVEKKQIYLDVFYNKEHIGTLPEYSSLGNTHVACFSMSESVEEFKRILKGGDVLIGAANNEEQKKAAVAASELGMPFITYPIISTILPDGIKFEEIEFPSQEVNFLSNLLIRSFQVIELLKLFTGGIKPFFAPNALKVEFDMVKLDFKTKKVRLKKRKKKI